MPIVEAIGADAKQVLIDVAESRCDSDPIHGMHIETHRGHGYQVSGRVKLEPGTDTALRRMIAKFEALTPEQQRAYKSNR